MGCFVKAIRMSSTPICPNTLTRFRTPSFCNAWRGESLNKHMLHLIKMWLKVPVEEKDEAGKKRLTGGKENERGTPQGGVMTA